MKIKLLFILQISMLFLVSIPAAYSHNVHEIEEMEVDVTPSPKQSRFGPVQVDIRGDSTFVTLATITDFTIRHGLFGQINITDFDLEYDGVEEYVFILHQEIYLDDIVPMKLGTRTKIISNNALRDGLIQFAYIMGDMNDIDGFTSDHVERIDDFSDSVKSLFHYSLDFKLEIQRGTKQNGTIYFDYDISSYLIPNIPTDAFHKELTLTTSIFPSSVQMQQTSTVYDNQRAFLILPIRLLPFYFSNPYEHSLNLTEIPISIYLDLQFEKASSIDLSLVDVVKVSQGSNNGRNEVNSLLNKDKNKRFRISTVLTESQLLSLTITTKDYGGSIDVGVFVKIKAIFTDTSLYAKNEYPVSPNQYILIMVFIGTVFTYKIVDYVDYRKYQETLAYKNYDLVEKDFVG